MDYSLIPTEKGVLVSLGHKSWLNSKCRLTVGKEFAHAFSNESQAREAIRQWILA